MKPILFNTEMVRAIHNGTKTVTRRLVKPQPTENPALKMCQDDVWRLEWWNVNEFHFIKVPICPGDILYVRETWANLLYPDGHTRYVYKATDTYPFGEKTVLQFRWHPSIHMPYEAARIFLRVTDVRVERLQDITPEQAVKEGVIGPENRPYIQYERVGQLEWYARNRLFPPLWDSTINPADRALYSWDANPWVWVIEFERCEKPEETE